MRSESIYYIYEISGSNNSTKLEIYSDLLYPLYRVFIFSVKFGEEFVEAGAQWIHGVKGNVAYKIASEMDLVDDPESGWLEEIGEQFYKVAQ